MAKAPDLTGTVKPGTDTMLALRRHVDGRLNGLRSERWSWWEAWRDLAQVMRPERYRWFVTPNQAYRGSPKNQAILDSTGLVAARTCANGMMGGLSSPAKPWFKLSIPGVTISNTSPARIWLDQVQQLMLLVFAESNYYLAKAQQLQDIVVFGTAPIIIYEDPKEVIRCYNVCAGEYYAANSARLTVDSLFREFTMTVSQLVQEFGIENCSQSVRSAWQTKGASIGTERVVYHAIEPNDRAISTAVPSLFKYREVYWEAGCTNPLALRVRGFHECPFSCPRWEQSSNDAYGRSPGMTALGDVKQLQLQQLRKAQAIDKMVNPPMVADVTMKNQPASLLPGGVTYVANVAAAGFRPAYEVRPELAEMIQDVAQTQERIKIVFFNDLFMMISNLETVRTATEIDARREEKLIQLGPVLERMQNESYDADIDRTFAIMQRSGLIPPAPPEMHGMPLQVEYVSMLAQAQKAASTAGIERLAQFVGNLAGADPAALDDIDFDQMIATYSDLLDVPPKVLRATAQVAQIRQQKAQAAQQQQAMQQTAAAVQGAQTLSQTQVGGGINALQAMLGNSAAGSGQQAA